MVSWLGYAWEHCLTRLTHQHTCFWLSAPYWMQACGTLAWTLHLYVTGFTMYDNGDITSTGTSISLGFTNVYRLSWNTTRGNIVFDMGICILHIIITIKAWILIVDDTITNGWINFWCLGWWPDKGIPRQKTGKTYWHTLIVYIWKAETCGLYQTT